MGKKGNGWAGNGHEEPKKESAPEDKLLQFPTLAERDRLRKMKERQEKQWREEYKSKNSPAPFFNFSRITPFTGTILIIFLAVHAVVNLFLPATVIEEIYYAFGFAPGRFTTQVITLTTLLSPLTHLFIHGSWTHLFFNSIMMMATGIFFERAYGARVTAFFFFACGLTGAAFCFAFNPYSMTPIIGASGSISGLFGAMTIILFQSRPNITRHGPWPLVLFWLAFMIGMGLLSGDTLAWQAHVGGFLAGIGLLFLLQRGKLRLR